MPLGVVGGLEIKNDWNQILDVLYSGGLAVQMSDGRSFGVNGAVVVVRRAVITKRICTGQRLAVPGRQWGRGCIPGRRQ